jgi:hypothetical protein
MMARVLDCGSSSRNFSNASSRTLPLISRNPGQSLVEVFSPLHKEYNVRSEKGKIHKRNIDPLQTVHITTIKLSAK